MTLYQGQILRNRYRVVSLIAQGGFGAVYRVWDLQQNLPFALKENLDHSPEAQKQFEQEANLLSRLSHPNLPQVFDYFIIPRQGQYLVMALIEGDDLHEISEQRGALSEEEVLPYIYQVIQALEYLHNQPDPIIHRDIKPANIIITPNGQAILVDFGIAKEYQSNGRTTRGARAVTPGISPPEQYGGGNTDARSDIYALGATLYTLLAGKEPPESIYRHTGQTIPTLHGVSSPITAAILKAMSLNPMHRFQTAVTFAQALQNKRQGVRSLTPIVVGLMVLAFLFLGAFVVRANITLPIPTPTNIAFAPATVTETMIPTPSHTATTPATVTNSSLSASSTPTATPPATAAATQTRRLTATMTPLPRATNTIVPTKTAPPIIYPIVYEIGYSTNHTRLDAYQFGNGSQVVVIIGGLHAGFAPSSVTVALKTITYFTDNPDKLPDGVTLFVLPNVNPDSLHFPGEKAGRLNGNEVDPNRNFDCNWQPVGKFRDGTINGGAAAFSEVETQAIRDFVFDVDPVAVIFYEAKATNGMITPGECNGRDSGSISLGQTYHAESNYEIYTGFDLTGDGSDWLTLQGIPSIAILLRDYDSLSNSEWRRNRDGILAVLDRYAD